MQEKLVYNKICIPSGEIGYIKIGNGPSLVMITRYAATLYNWDSNLITGLAKSFTLYLFDWRGVGSSKTTNTCDIIGCVTDVFEAIETLKLYQPLLLGWSFGGIIVQQLYKLYKNNISGLVLLSSFSDPRLASQEFIDLSMDTDNSLDEQAKIDLYQLMLSEIPTKECPNRMKNSVLAIDNYHYRYTLEAKKLHNQFVQTSPASTNAELEAINPPTLILNARNDSSFPKIGYETLSAYIPNSKLIVYPTGGHLLIHHHGLEIASDITTFFIRSQTC